MWPEFYLSISFGNLFLSAVSNLERLGQMKIIRRTYILHVYASSSALAAFCSSDYLSGSLAPRAPRQARSARGFRRQCGHFDCVINSICLTRCTESNQFFSAIFSAFFGRFASFSVRICGLAFCTFASD